MKRFPQTQMAAFFFVAVPVSALKMEIQAKIHSLSLIFPLRRVLQVLCTIRQMPA